ncbi:MAG: hypothetical protein J2P57_16375 [Acidimicrobiaceae bacterium]|nr:hypothetical protein [Acidimicrobiaceae bacterium]
MSSTDLPPRASERQALTAVLTALERDLAASEAPSLPDDMVRRLLAAAVKLYAAAVERADGPVDPFPDGQPVSATDVCVTVAGILDAANVDLFELVAWRSFG